MKLANIRLFFVPLCATLFLIACPIAAGSQTQPGKETNVVVVANDNQRSVRLQQIEAQKAREMGRAAHTVSTTVAQLVRDGRAMKQRQQKCGSRVWTTWEPTDALRRLVSPQASTALDFAVARERVLSFCADADADRSLRAQAEAVGIDPDQWRDWIDYAG